MMRRAVFLDRDGVLNRTIIRDGKPHPPSRLSECEVLPGVVEACTSLRAAGFLLIVVTNQPDVARGTQSREIVEAINAMLRLRVLLDDVRVCYHDDADDCPCRKPKPGMLLHAAQDWEISLVDSFLVGDRWKDIEAGRRAGCRSILIDYGYADAERIVADAFARSLAEAAAWILRRCEAKDGGMKG